METTGRPADTTADGAGTGRITRLKAITGPGGIFAGAALIATALVAGYLDGQRAALRALHADASHQLDVFHAAFFAPVERFEYLPDVLAAHPLVVGALTHADAPQARDALNAFLERVNAKANSAAVYVMNRDGLTIAASNWALPESFVGKNFAYRPYFQEALKGKPGRFYGVGAVTIVPGYFLASAVRNDDGIVGVIAVKIDLDTLGQRWRAETDQITVTDDSGIVFLSSNPAWKYRATRPLPPDVVARLRATRQYASFLKEPIAVRPDFFWRDSRVVRITDPLDGTTRRYLTLSRTLPQADWTITTYSPMEQAQRTAVMHAFTAAAGTGFLLLLVMYLALVRRRIGEQEAARQAAARAHEQLEAKHKELEILSRDLQTMAISDPLTGCHNRRYFTEIAGKMVGAAQRHDRRIAVLMLDVDRFKKINDTHGHPIGDDVLKAVAGACRAILRQPDFLVRFGGEEFAAILPDTDSAEARHVAERLRTAVQLLKVQTVEAEIGVTVSIGISEYARGEPSLDKALSRADAALYHAKRTGRNRAVVYRPVMEENAEPEHAPTA